MADQDPAPPAPSVHMQLRDMAPTPSTAPSNIAASNNISDNLLRFLTYLDPVSQEPWVAIGTSKRKFRAFLQSRQVLATDEMFVSWEPATETLLRHFRTLFQARRLLTDTLKWVKEPRKSITINSEEEDAPLLKPGCFEERLLFQVDRFVEVLQDELDDRKTPEKSLVTWLEEHYGKDETHAILSTQLRQQSPDQQLKLLKHFLEWFRSVFPYYYDRCLHCGASQKDDNNNNNDNNENEKKENDTNQQKEDPVEDEHDDGGTCIGQVYPSPEELEVGKASRVEVYCCHKCHQIYQFPRYNAAWSIIGHKRGRCGEYSILLYRLMRALGHADQTRYVVDWADHVWVELKRHTTTSSSSSSSENGEKNNTDNDNYEWIHMDPCEAAVDEPLLYQGWGKKAKYLIAFYAPPFPNKDENGKKTLGDDAMIEDVTHNYTSDSAETIDQRRESDGEDEMGIQLAIAKAITLLGEKVNKIL